MNFADFDSLGRAFGIVAFDLVWRSTLLAGLCVLLELTWSRRTAEARHAICAGC